VLAQNHTKAEYTHQCMHMKVTL